MTGGVIRTGFILMAMFGLLTLASDCRAFFYRPAAALSILSEYASLNGSAPPHTQVWKIVPEAGPDGAATLRFFQEAAAGSDAVCVLILPPSGSVGEIIRKEIGKSGEKRSVTGLLLAPGFPVPCDVLPLGEKESGRVYMEKVEAGGRVFSRSYRVAFDGFRIGEAKAMGWIRGGEPGAAELIMVTVTDEKGRLSVRQLWPAGGSWWLYEETPLRRSWLID
ncbi:MAG: hypothetical protein JXL20_02475 [Deltaproteobacteria bacterium]|nr:hypothetical protein [Deltaproteobacteria bacterium]